MSVHQASDMPNSRESRVMEVKLVRSADARLNLGYVVPQEYRQLAGHPQLFAVEMQIIRIEHRRGGERGQVVDRETSIPQRD